MQIIDGKKIAGEIKLELRKEVDKILASGERAPHLAVVLIGTDGASETYVKNKMRSCKEVGFNSTLIRYDSSVNENVTQGSRSQLNTRPTELKNIKLSANGQLSEMSSTQTRHQIIIRTTTTTGSTATQLNFTTTHRECR